MILHSGCGRRRSGTDREERMTLAQVSYSEEIAEDAKELIVDLDVRLLTKSTGGEL